jgi:hypothetical protein
MFLQNLYRITGFCFTFQSCSRVQGLHHLYPDISSVDHVRKELLGGEYNE